MKYFMLAAALALALCCGSSATASSTNYHLVKTYVLGGEGGWDYLTYDASGKRLFIARGTHVMVSNGTLSVVRQTDPAHFGLVQNAATAKGARTMAFDPRTGAVFLVTSVLAENPNAASERNRYSAVPGTFRLIVMEP